VIARARGATEPVSPQELRRLRAKRGLAYYGEAGKDEGVNQEEAQRIAQQRREASRNRRQEALLGTPCRICSEPLGKRSRRGAHERCYREEARARIAEERRGQD
jgi:hypothetical protein